MNSKTLFFVLALVAVAVAAYWLGNRQATSGVAPEDGQVTINRAEERTVADAPKEKKRTKATRRTVAVPKPTASSTTPSKPASTAAATNDQAPFAERFNALKERAEAGDSMAACEIVKTLQTCQGLKRTRLQMASATRQQRNQKPSEKPEQIKRLNERVDKLNTRLGLMEQTCSGLTKDDHQQAFYYQQLGALHGSPELQRMFVLNPALSGMNYAQMIESLRLYQEAAPAVGLEMLERGDASAVGYLAYVNMPDNGVWADADPMQGAIYTWLSQQISSDPNDADNESEAESLRDRLRIMHDLTDAQIDEAKAEAAAMRDRYFPDWDSLSKEEREKRLNPYWSRFQNQDENQLDLTCNDTP